MRNFIQQQQELASEMYFPKGGCDFDTIITEIITNTGEELMRRAEGGAVVHKDGGLAMIPAHKVFEHIASVTGVE